MNSRVVDPVELYLSQVAKVPPLSKEEENTLFEQLRQGDDPDASAERKLVESRLSLVVDVAKQYSSSGMPLLELFEEGNLGLMKAVRTFGANPVGEFTA
jgi:DNA-directed RNA polymerase sigma subunit (sigma70/sigma32)